MPAMEFFEVVDTQRAIRRFRADPVPEALVRRVLEAATRAPSARGAEPWAFVVVRDPGTRRAVGDMYRTAWDAAAQWTDAMDADRDVLGGAALPDLREPTKAQLEAAMKGHVLASAELVGTYAK